MKIYNKSACQLWWLTTVTAMLGLLAITLPAVAQPYPTSAPDQSTPVPDQENPLIIEHESMLMNLYNGLIRAGVMQGPLVPSRRVLWHYLNAAAMLAGLEAFFGPEAGGFITAQSLYDSTASYTMEGDEDGKIFLNLFSPPQHIWFTNRSGILSCSEEPVSRYTFNLALVLQQNVRCRYALFLRNAYLIHQPGEFSLDYVLISGVVEELSNYLEALKNQGIIQDYWVALDEGKVGIELFPDTPSVQVPDIKLPLELVNIYATAAEEAAIVAQGLASNLQRVLIFPRPHGRFMGLDRLLLRMALQKVADLVDPTPAQKRFAFFEALGYGAYLSLLLPTPTPEPLNLDLRADPCDDPYLAGRVTPCNKKVAVVWGRDRNHAYAVGGFEKFRAEAQAYGYSGADYVMIDGRARQPRGSTLASMFKAVKESQIVIFNTHGAPGGDMLLQVYNFPAYESYPNVSVTKECCEALKKTAQELQLQGANSINCTSKPYDYMDPSHSISIVGEHDALAGTTDLLCAIYAYKELFENLGKKAIVLTAQCYGGRVPPLAPLISGSFMDFVGQTIETNYPDPERCDDEILAKDVQGDRLYCKLLSAPPPPYNEPWEGAASAGACGVDKEQYPVPGCTKGVQDSVTIRGAYGVFGELKSCHTEYNSGGWRQYNAASLGGDPNTSVELAPHVSSAGFSSNSKSFSASFSSKVDPDNSDIEVTFENCRKRRSTAKEFVEGGSPQLTAEGASFQLSEDIWTLDSGIWSNSSPGELRNRYGADQSDWPWYVKVKITGQAPNGIKLIGNSGASKKWIWADKTISPNTAPWLYTNGIRGTGGNEIEIRIPCNPPVVCCKPRIETRQCKRGESIVTYCMQNGCTAEEGVFQRDCYTQGPGSEIGEHCGERFPGVAHFPWFETCKGKASDTQCDSVKILPEGLPPEEQDCAMHPELTIAHQYKSWPVDVSDPVQCPVIVCPPTPSPIPDCPKEKETITSTSSSTSAPVVPTMVKPVP